MARQSQGMSDLRVCTYSGNGAGEGGGMEVCERKRKTTVGTARLFHSAQLLDSLFHINSRFLMASQYRYLRNTR